mgnify:FL=1
MNTYAPSTILAPVRNRIWTEDNGTETMLCKYCGTWQACFDGIACPTCEDHAIAESICIKCMENSIANKDTDTCAGCDTDAFLSTHEPY